MDWWNVINAAQATIISSVITFLTAVVGVLLGGRLFQGKVSDLRSALEASQRDLALHRDFVTIQLGTIAESLTALGDQAASTIEGLGQVRGEMSDLNSVEPDPAADAVQPNAALGDDLGIDAFREDWSRIRDSLEAKAADPDIDGRTRARYGRIDRRNYHDLITALARDGRLPNEPLFREAVDIWYAHRTGRSAITKERAARLKLLRQQCVVG